MTDHELLESAAKAAGIIVNYVRYDGGETYQEFFDPLDESGYEMGWDPLTDDGDALRLAVKLHLNVMSNETTSWVAAGKMVRAEELNNGDSHAATRRAIVRVAAEIGKEMIGKEMK